MTTQLTLNLYKRCTNICEMSDVFLYYPRDVKVAKLPFEIPYGPLKPFDLSRPLEPEYAISVFSFLLKKRIGKLGMFSSIYFYDPIYGYCTCNAVINQYHPSLNVEDHFTCQCKKDIISNRKSPPPPHKIVETTDIE
jgi:hypothetical protein